MQTQLFTAHAKSRSTFKLWSVLILALWLVTISMPILAQEFPEPNTADDHIAMVNLNEDDAATLAALLTGIGETRALAIVAHREQNGPFTSIDDLAEVAGIGPATIAANRDRMVVHADQMTP